MVSLAAIFTMYFITLIIIGDVLFKIILSKDIQNNKRVIQKKYN